ARAADGFILSPPFAPTACWCARTIVASIMICSKSGSSAKTLKRLSQMPLRDHLLNRVNTLFHLPNADGRSRHGAPVRKIQSTASTKRRLSSPVRPLSPSLLALIKHGGHCVASGKRHEVDTTRAEQYLRSHQERIGADLCEVRKGSVDLEIGAR